MTKYRLLILILNLLFLATYVVAWKGNERILQREALQYDMSTKTRYPMNLTAPLLNTSEHQIATEIESCHVLQMNYVIRHGTRYPTTKDIKRIESVHAFLKEEIKNVKNEKKLSKAQIEAYQFIQHWKSPYNWFLQAEISELGAHELIAMGKRLRQRFGLELSTHASDKTYLFSHTYKIRTKQSASAFAYGYFNGWQPVPLSETQDASILRFYDSCPKFTHMVEQNSSALAAHMLYKSEELMSNSLKALQNLLGIKSLTLKHMEAMYAGCAFDVALSAIEDDWCSLFTDDMIYIMDFYHDLKHFHRKSYGNTMAYEIASPLLKDIIITMKNRINQRNDKTGLPLDGIFRFAHAETIIPLASLLNISASNSVANYTIMRAPYGTLDEIKVRQFKSSRLAPFSANIGFILYECHNAGNSNTTAPEYKVKILLNEQEVRLPICNYASMCPIEILEKNYHHWIHDYNFEEICAVPFSNE